MQSQHLIDHSAANRGKRFEDAIVAVCRTYRARGEALITKRPDPTKKTQGRYVPDGRGGKKWVVIGAVPDSNADKGVDFDGVWKGVPICFDAKQTAESSLPLKNIKEAQMEYMRDFTAQGGRAFLLVHHIEKVKTGRATYRLEEHVYVLPFAVVWAYWKAAGRDDPLGRKKPNARQSIPAAELKRWPEVRAGRGVVLDFLPAVEQAWELLAQEERPLAIAL